MNHRKFTSGDQDAFAELSGDYNPLHMDAIVARRLLFGSQVVHGIHSLLWALDSWLEDKRGNIELRSIKSVFSKPIRVGEKVSLLFKGMEERLVVIELLSGDSIMTTIQIEWDESEQRQLNNLEARFPKKRQSRSLSEDEIEAKSGSLDLCLNVEVAAKYFPHLVRCVSPHQIAVIIGTTRLVGVECPGLHSLYTELNLFSTDTAKCAKLKYEVTKFNKGFGLVFMNIIALGMTGIIKAFVRPKPQSQDSCQCLKGLVNGNEFSGQRALVVGGSRGLGEVTAKLLSVGGAEVKITYHQGTGDARRVVDEIISEGGSADSFSFDVLDDQSKVAEKLGNGWAPTHLYYFATPFIALGTKEVFSATLFQQFCDYYVIGFQRIVKQLGNLGLRGVLFPSSVFVNELQPNMGEYAAAKMAGEVLCSILESTQQDITIHKPRLPKMATDQTVDLMPLNNQDPASIMLEHLRNLRVSSISQ